MGGWTSATKEQEDNVTYMIDKMMNPSIPPTDMSYTLGWDVIVSYSEVQINALLARRHAENASAKMIKEVQLDVKQRDRRTKKFYTTSYKLIFGPPRLQFNSRSISGPSCSMIMDILEGTETIDDETNPVDKGFALKISGIPLGTASGKLVDGNVQAESTIRAGEKTVNFDYDEDQEAHVVLNLPLASDGMTITCEATDPSAAATSPYAADDFQAAFKTFFLDPTQVSALSYSIASVNNTSPKGKRNDLEPQSFQFASFAQGSEARGDAVTILSIFIQTKGGASTGQREGLQASWAAQWINNGMSPIPTGFTASLILSASLVYNQLLKPGLKRSSWTCDALSSKSGIELRACNDDSFTAANESFPYSKKSSLWMEGFDIDLKKWPMDLTIKQKDAKGSPAAFAKWHLQADCRWQDDGKFLDISFMDTTWGDGQVRLDYRICDPNDNDKPREIPCKVVLDDEKFDLNISLDSTLWKVDHGKTPGSGDWDDFADMAPRTDIWDKALARVKKMSPEVSIQSIGLGFLRTTNLLTPGKEVIDFNEQIGVKIPRDLVLVGNVVPGKVVPPAPTN